MLISIIIPCFNNEHSIETLVERLQIVLQSDIFSGHSFELVFVDDGSSDNTFLVQSKIKFKYPDCTKIVKLTRNFGSYNSFLAGMQYAKGDANVYLHADLQDPPELISEMFKHYLNGYKYVIANRIDREDRSVFSNLYHWTVKKFAIKNIPNGGFDLIMFDKTVKAEILKIGEKNTNNVYLISWLGFPYISIPYKREKRERGVSQWTLLGKMRLFVDTIFSFTKIPIWVARVIFFFSLFYSVLTSITLLETSKNFILSNMHKSIMFVATSLLLLIVIEYLDRIHESVRNRPNFVVDVVL